MAKGIQTTHGFLQKSPNRATNEVLLAGLDCKNSVYREKILKTIMARKDINGHREIFKRLGSLSQADRKTILQRPQALTKVIDEIFQEATPSQVSAACKWIVSLRLYDTFPTLVELLKRSKGKAAALAAQTLSKLAECYYEEMSTSKDKNHFQKLQEWRGRITMALEESVRLHPQHQRNEAVEAYLMVIKPSDPSLRRFLASGEEKAHGIVVEILSTSQAGGVLRLLLGLLEDPSLPKKALEIVSNRVDPKFVEYFVEKMGREQGKKARARSEVLLRLKELAWAKPGHETFVNLDLEHQAAAIRVLVWSGLEKPIQLEMVEYTLFDGNVGGRRSAAKALARFEGVKVDQMVSQGINDPDPQVRAQLIPQLRKRNISGAMTTLLEMIDDPDPKIREALRCSLPEFSFRQFMMNFDNLPEQVQTLCGHLVSKLHDNTVEKLSGELCVLSPVRRRRAILACEAMGLIGEFESQLQELIADSDHIVRAAAACALAHSENSQTWEALRDAMFDRSVMVQEAAEQSLKLIANAMAQNKEDEEASEEASGNPEELTSVL